MAYAERYMASRAVLTDAHWLREITSFVDGLPGLLLAFQKSNKLFHDKTEAAASLVDDAIEAQDLRVLTVLDRLSRQPMYAACLGFTSALEVAAARGRLQSLQWLFQRPCHLSGSTTAAPVPPPQLLDAVVSGEGDVQVAQWLLTAHPMCCAQVATVSIDTAAANGHLDIIQWLHHAGQYEAAFQSSATDCAATNGHQETVLFLLAQRRQGCSVEAPVGAASRGHFDVLQLLSHHSPHLFASSPRILDAAAEGSEPQRLDMVRFLHETCHAPCTHAAVDNAVTSGNLEVTRYLLSNRQEGFSTKAVAAAAIAGRLDILRILLPEVAMSPPPSLMNLVPAITAAARLGHTDIVRLLLPHLQRQRQNVGAAIRAAATWGHLAIVKLLVSEGEWLSLLDAASQASYQNHREIVEFLKQAHTERQAKRSMMSEAA